MRLAARVVLVSASLATAVIVMTAPMAAGSASPTPGPSPSTGADEDGASAEDLISFGIAPAGRELPDNRAYLEFTAPPGAVLYEHVAILNQDDAPITLNVYSADVLPGDGGGLAVQERAEANLDAGGWIGVDGSGLVEVPAQTAETGVGFTIVPIAISIPANATPGDHVGAVVASVNAVSSGEGNTPGIDLEQRVAARIYIRVQGELKPALEITDITADWRAASILGNGSVAVTYTLRNTGNVRMGVEPAVTIAGPFDLLPRTAAGDPVPDLLPGGEVTVTTTVDGVWAMLRHTVTIDATTVAPLAGPDPELGTITATTTVWLIPWLAIAVLLLLIALGVIAVRRRRRRRQRAKEAPPGGRRSRRNGVSGPTEGTPVKPSATSTDHVPAGAGHP